MNVSNNTASQSNNPVPKRVQIFLNRNCRLIDDLNVRSSLKSQVFLQIDSKPCDLGEKMKPVEAKNTAADLFRLELVNIIDMRHELVKLAEPLQICQIPHKPIIR